MSERWQKNPELLKKEKKLEGLARIINLHGGQVITASQQSDIDMWQDKLEFRLNELILRSKLEELDIKIGVYEEVIKVINRYKR